MIEEKIKIHGGESFEIDLGYMYNKAVKKSTYDIDTYIFIPRSLDINSETYTKTEFFQDLKTNIRFITPVYKLEEITDGEKSAYNSLKNSISAYQAKKHTMHSKQFRYHVKMYISIFRSSLSKQIHGILLCSDKEEKRILLEKLFVAVPDVVSKYRNLTVLVNKNNYKERETNVYQFGDEFISYSVEKQFLLLIRKLSKSKKLTQELEQAKAILKTELEYQHKNNILSLSTDPKSTNEDTVYRRGILRKFAEDRLFLNTRTTKEGLMMEQLIFSLAAGLAMIFATGIAFLSQLYYGNFSMPLFVALVISYMAKDRIKELVRNNINNKIQSRYFFDHKTKIISGEEEIGVCRESFDFIKETQVPSLVKKYRKREHLTEIENDWKGENIMHYRKRVRIYNKRFGKVLKEYDITGIKDIVRLNISRFTTQMSTAYLPFYAWNEQEEKVKRVKSEKVYHINMILVFNYQDKKNIKRYRIFLNKKGIKRIEKVIT